jgi:hypothetical protein
MLEIWQLDMKFHRENEDQQPTATIKEASVKLL